MMSERDGQLEIVFGGPNDEAFGSAVFRRALSAAEDLETPARAVYRDFVGELWDRYGAAAWLGAWSLAAARAAPAAGSIVGILEALEDPQTRSAADMLVNGGADPDAARAALVAAFDREAVDELKVFSLGDGGAMSGLMIAARDRDGAAVFLVFLMD